LTHTRLFSTAKFAALPLLDGFVRQRIERGNIDLIRLGGNDSFDLDGRLGGRVERRADVLVTGRQYVHRLLCSKLQSTDADISPLKVLGFDLAMRGVCIDLGKIEPSLGLAPYLELLGYAVDRLLKEPGSGLAMRYLKIVDMREVGCYAMKPGSSPLFLSLAPIGSTYVRLLTSDAPWVECYKL
jgi:hypothetical protein